MQHEKKIGIDVGGSHITACLMNITSDSVIPEKTIRNTLDAQGTAEEIIASIAACILELRDEAVTGTGIAFPGPFDYPNGICAIANVGGKFRHLFGLHVKQALQDTADARALPVAFFNDAHCFAAGALQMMGIQGRRTVLVTLGTGFGSAFLRDGFMATTGEGIPASGAYYNEPFGNGYADDHFSTRWLLTAFQQHTGITVASVREMAEQHREASRPVFEDFGHRLGQFLRPRLTAFHCEELVIGGNIAKAYSLFSEPLIRQLEGLPVQIFCCGDTEACILAGAAISEHDAATITDRRTSQALLPASSSPHLPEGYNIYPSFHSEQPVYHGYPSLANLIADERLVIIDGYGGALWERFRSDLHTVLQNKGRKVRWYNVNACLKDQGTIDGMLKETLNGDDPVFGKRYEGDLIDFFDPEKLEMIRPDDADGLHIIYGTGAALTGQKGLTLYVDVPKNEIQYRLRAGSVSNIGTSTQSYKRCYFADWPVLNKHKQSLLPQIDGIIDGQRPDDITWMPGHDLRRTLDKMLSAPFRARPWFEAGVWGGNWMKQHIQGLNPDEVNYAWSFELITPENGIVLEGAGKLLEVSFDLLLFHHHHKLLGKAAKRFGTAFPIRFDFLDTYDGDNLSIQCHPRPQYIREHFGEQFTQDETYYILDCEPDACVYLGFQDNIRPAEFRAALEDALVKGTPVEATRYVQQFTASRHDLFLIPNGTVHASGRNNLVLEISSTPYIFTFKMYDWLRKDLNGRPRPIHLDHAFANLYFDRKGDAVTAHLISRPQLAEEWDGGKKWKLPTHAEHFYTVDRYEFQGQVTIPTNGQCHICMLVEGGRLEVSANGHQQTFQYAETFVIPAAVTSYTCHYTGKGTAYLVVAYVKDSAC